MSKKIRNLGKEAKFVLSEDIEIETDETNPLDIEITLEEENEDEVENDLKELENSYSGTNVLKLYFQDIGAKDRIDFEEEQRLGRIMVDGKVAKEQLNRNKNLSNEEKEILEERVRLGEEARNNLIEANYRLVVAIAKRYVKSSKLDFMDLIQEGNLGLIKAVDKFDPYRGFKFSTFATWWIRQSVTRGMAQTGRTIRLPVNIIELSRKVRQFEASFAAENFRDPTDEEIAKGIDEDVKKIKYMRRVESTMVSLHVKTKHESNSELQDMIADESNTPEKQLLQEQLEKTLEEMMEKHLTEREISIVKMRMGYESGLSGKKMTLAQVSEIIGLTKERVRQIEKAAIAKLQSPEIKDELESFYKYLNK